MAQTTARHRLRADARHRRDAATVDTASHMPRSLRGHELTHFEFSLLDGDSGLCAQDLLAALCRDGVVLLRLAAADQLAAVMEDCFRACHAFFARPFHERARHGAGPGVGQLHGWMEYLSDEEGSECFEAKVHYDPAFTWPDRPRDFKRCVVRARNLLARTARTVLLALTRALGLEPASIQSLLDVGAAAGDRAVELSSASHAAMRVWQYTHSRPAGLHCDNSLLTLAPAATAVGLRVHSPSAGAILFPEAQMAADEVLVFAGDALSFLTAGRVPAAMHQVLPPATAAAATAAATAPRLSAPFFLRGRRNALLHSTAKGMAPLAVCTLEHNADNLRSQWPWKQGAMAAYYQGQTWHESEGQTWHETCVAESKVVHGT